MIDLKKLEKDLISEINLSPLQAQVFLLVNYNGKMSPDKISQILHISYDDALQTSKELMNLGAFIDISENEFEAMHPRFTAVNMYRKRCQRDNVEFKRNKVVDNIGVILEKAYDDARTKYR